MQLSKVVAVTGGSITVKELRVKDVRNLMADMSLFEGLSLKDLFLHHFDELVGFLLPLLELNGVVLDELTFSELAAVKEAVVEVNKTFLDLTGLAAIFSQTALNPEPQPTPDATSTEPAPSLSNEVTAV